MQPLTQYFPHMPNQPNLLAQVRRYLISRGEAYQWVTMGPESEKIGLAYVPIVDTALPCTFMFTELREPCSLVFDVHFAYRVAREELQELGMLLLTLNANLPEGQLMLDMDSGFVYFRLKYVVEDFNVSPEDILSRIEHMESIGMSISHSYARIIAQEFPPAF